MIEEKHKLLNNGVPMSEITDFDEKVDMTLEDILDEFDYEPEDKEGLSKALRDECYNHMAEFVEDEGSSDDLKQNFYRVKSDFDQAPEGHARSSLSIMIGSRSTREVDSEAVRKDIIHISNHMLEKKYNRD